MVQEKDEIGKTLKALLISRAQEDVSISTLDNDYKEMEGTRIPYLRFNFPNLISFLKSIPQYLSVVPNGATTYVVPVKDGNSAHILNLVEHQRPARNAPRKKNQLGGRRPPTNFRPSRHFPVGGSTRATIPSYVLQELLQIVKSEGKISKHYLLHEAKQRMPHSPIALEDVVRAFRELSHEVYMDEFNVISMSKESSSAANPNWASWSKNEVVRPSSKPVISQGIPAGSEGRSNSIVRPKEKTATSQRPENPENTLDSWHRKPEVNDYGKSMLINDRVQARLRKLIENNPEGIWCTDLPKKYHEAYNIKLQYEDLGFNSVLDFAAYLPDIFHHVQLQVNGDFILYDANKSIPSLRSPGVVQKASLASLYNIYPDSNGLEAVPEQLSRNTSNKLIPDDVLNEAETVHPICVSQLKSVEKVTVVEVFNPSFFWIHHSNNSKKLKTLMEEIRDFYSAEGDKYKIPKIVLKTGKGLNCVSLFNDVWHRGVIKDVKPNGRVTILFYDFGTIQTQKEQEPIYYLHRRFSRLPAVAIPCALSGIEPFDDTEWSSGAKIDFSKFTFNQSMIADIKSTDLDNNSAMIHLKNDDPENQSFYIHEWLLQQKHAKKGNLVCNPDANYLHHLYNNCLKRKGYVVSSIAIAPTQAAKKSAALSTSSMSEMYKLLRQQLKNSRKTKPVEVETSVSKLSVDPISVTCSDVVSSSDDSNSSSARFERMKKLKALMLRKKAETRDSDNDSLSRFDSREKNVCEQRAKLEDANVEQVEQVEPEEEEESESSVDSPRPLVLPFARKSNKKPSFFGSLHSFSGGNGRTGKIDWDKILISKEEKESSSSKPVDPLTDLKKARFLNDKPLSVGRKSFLKTLRNNSLYHLRNRDLCWDSEGNIKQFQVDHRQLLELERKKKEGMQEEITKVVVPQEIALKLRGVPDCDSSVSEFSDFSNKDSISKKIKDSKYSRSLKECTKKDKQTSTTDFDLSDPTTADSGSELCSNSSRHFPTLKSQGLFSNIEKVGERKMIVELNSYDNYEDNEEDEKKEKVECKIDSSVLLNATNDENVKLAGNRLKDSSMSYVKNMLSKLDNIANHVIVNDSDDDSDYRSESCRNSVIGKGDEKSMVIDKNEDVAKDYEKWNEDELNEPEYNANYLKADAVSDNFEDDKWDVGGPVMELFEGHPLESLFKSAQLKSSIVIDEINENVDPGMNGRANVERPDESLNVSESIIESSDERDSPSLNASVSSNLDSDLESSVEQKEKIQEVMKNFVIDKNWQPPGRLKSLANLLKERKNLRV